MYFTALTTLGGLLKYIVRLVSNTVKLTYVGFYFLFH